MAIGEHTRAPWAILILLVAILVAACNGPEGDAAPDLSMPTMAAEVPESVFTATTPAPTPTPHMTDEVQEERLVVPTSIPPSPAYEPDPAIRDADLEALILQTLGQDSQSYGVVVRNLTTGTEAVVNPDKVFCAASLYKLPIL